MATPFHNATPLNNCYKETLMLNLTLFKKVVADALGPEESTQILYKIALNLVALKEKRYLL